MSDQHDADENSWFVWMFPLRRKITQARTSPATASDEFSYFPHGAYAIIQSKLVWSTRAQDRLKDAGIVIVDRRDIDLARYQKAILAWHSGVLDRVRSSIRALIAKKRRIAKMTNREFMLTDDELKINAASDEKELRAALTSWIETTLPAPTKYSARRGRESQCQTHRNGLKRFPSLWIWFAATVNG